MFQIQSHESETFREKNGILNHLGNPFFHLFVLEPLFYDTYEFTNTIQESNSSMLVQGHQQVPYFFLLHNVLCVYFSFKEKMVGYKCFAYF